MGVNSLNIPETVKRERKILGYNQEDFALRVGVSLSFLRNLEQGRKNLMLNKVEEVLSFLGYKLTTQKVSRET